ncbi:MAG: cbb3-type cytochrome c oxidase subunit I [Anaerolineae bacterium]|nr:cbb3-type cytochrome c oxidase subunit I [Anaerolineae bacterium]
MPKLSVWMVRAALVHLGIGFLFGALILHHKGVPIYAWTWQLLSPHTEFVIFGWTMQFVMGIAFWILPRFSGERRYGRAGLGWWSFALVNGGVLLTALGDWFINGPLVLAGRVAVLAAVVLFVIVIWPRVKPLGGYAASLTNQKQISEFKEHNHESA